MSSRADALPRLEQLGDLSGKRVLVRADLNVPLSGEGDERVVADDFRIRAVLPTLRWLAERGAKLTVCSHLGRPKGPDPRYSMAPVARRLAELLDDVEVEVRENLRFDPRETANDPSFVDELVEGQDCFVNDAFGACHREHASVVGPPKRLPSAAGRLVVSEVEVLSSLLDDPARPFVAVIGGAKVSDKLGVLRALAPKVDALLVGGGMCFTFFLADGRPVGDSLVEEGLVEECRSLLGEVPRLLLPEDVVTLASDEPFGRGAEGGTVEVSTGGVPDGRRGLDVGPATIERWSRELSGAKTVLWNGPLGVFEDPRFAGGTRAIAEAVAQSGAFSVVGLR
jgi:phosphoglycerate kinase